MQKHRIRLIHTRLLKPGVTPFVEVSPILSFYDCSVSDVKPNPSKACPVKAFGRHCPRLILNNTDPFLTNLDSTIFNIIFLQRKRLYPTRSSRGQMDRNWLLSACSEVGGFVLAVKKFPTTPEQTILARFGRQLGELNETLYNSIRSCSHHDDLCDGSNGRSLHGLFRRPFSHQSS